VQAVRHGFWWFVENALGATFVIVWLSVIAWYMIFVYDEGDPHGVGYHPDDSIDCFYVRDGDDC